MSIAERPPSGRTSKKKSGLMVFWRRTNASPPAIPPVNLPWAHETFDRLRDLLPEEQRVILEMKVAGHSSREIGDRLGVSERTVQRVLESLRARAKLGD